MSIPVKISVLMSLYNTDFEVSQRAIRSVLNQDFQEFELIIIDDGSLANDRDSLLRLVEAQSGTGRFD